MVATGTEFEVRRIGGRIGAEIRGVDLTAELTSVEVDRIHHTLLAHKAVFFREQRLTDADQVRFASLFGDLTTAHPTVPAVSGAPHVLSVDSDDGARANQWHTDVTFVRTPPKLSTLRGIVIPPYGGNTLIANTAAAYQDLPEPLREFADRLWAVHSNAADYVRPTRLDGPRDAHAAAADERYQVFTSRVYRSAHPVVRVHPETGERGLFIGAFAERLVGLSTTESRDILRLLQSYVTRPENIVRWSWQPGDVVLFDNRVTQHYAPDDYGDLPRLLHRVTVAGDAPAGVDGARSQVLEGDEAPHYTPAVA
jgi:taurine dioxygenase